MSHDNGPAYAASAESASEDEAALDAYQPRTTLGRRLLALRRKYLTRGGELLDADALDAAMRVRRGGANNRW